MDETKQIDRNGFSLLGLQFIQVDCVCLGQDSGSLHCVGWARSRLNLTINSLQIKIQGMRVSVAAGPGEQGAGNARIDLVVSEAYVFVVELLPLPCDTACGKNRVERGARATRIEWIQRRAALVFVTSARAERRTHGNTTIQHAVFALRIRLSRVLARLAHCVSEIRARTVQPLQIRHSLIEAGPSQDRSRFMRRPMPQKEFVDTGVKNPLSWKHVRHLCLQRLDGSGALATSVLQTLLEGLVTAPQAHILDPVDRRNSCSVRATAIASKVQARCKIRLVHCLLNF